MDGYIGIEMVENLYNLGIEVTIIELSDHLIGALDKDISSFINNYLKEKKINVILQNGVQRIEAKDNNLTIILENGSIETDMVIMAIGVKPDSSLAIRARLDINRRGSIITNDKMQTSDENIYAIRRCCRN